MNEVQLTIHKRSVYDEVAKTSAYTGKKMDGDESAYERIFATDEDRQMLERFWREACSAATEQFKPFLVSVSAQTNDSIAVALDQNYDVTLELSSGYDTTLNGSVENSLFSFFVQSITGKWFTFTNKKEAEQALKDAAMAMEDVVSKIYYRKKPKRPNLAELMED